MDILTNDTVAKAHSEGSPSASSIAISQFTAFSVDEYVDAYLSLAANHSIASKDPTSEVCPERGRLTAGQHFEKLLVSAGLRIPSVSAVLGISCRNVLANFRCGAWVRGVTPSLLTVEHEDPSRSRRPYHFLSFRAGRFNIDEEFPVPSYLNSCSWVMSGVPIYWDGEDVDERMLAEIADFSHLFELPRGADPLVTRESVARWRVLREAVEQCLYLPREEAAEKFRKLTSDLAPQERYLHNCAGVTDDGRLIVIIANASLKEIAAKLAALGARRAIVLDNGGSSSVFYFRNTEISSGIQLVAGPNFRPAGTAYIFVVLRSDHFRSLPARSCMITAS